MLTFKVSLTTAVMAFIAALGTCLIVVQTASFHAAARSAASATMDAASSNTLSQIEAEVSQLSTVLRVLSTARSLAEASGRCESGPAIGLFKAVLKELPLTDTLYVGYENGCWLQVRRLDTLTPPERQRLDAPAAAFYNINVVEPSAIGPAPLHRRFEDAQGHENGRLDRPDFGYDPRQRPWYRDTMRADRSLVSSPYASFSIGTPVITVSAPLRGAARGVVAADLKLDTFSDLVQAQRPGRHGEAIVFDAFGVLLAHPEFARFVAEAHADPADSRLPNIGRMRTGRVGQVMRLWDGSDRYQGFLRDKLGRSYLFLVQRFSRGDFTGYSLLLAQENDFARDVRAMQTRGLVIALVICGGFLPAVWVFADRMSATLKRLTSQAVRLRALEPPEPAPVTSRIVELHELGRVIAVGRRTTWSFARFVPRDIVNGIIDGSIATELGGTRQEVTVLFSDVRNFTGIAEAAEPDSLMHQTSRHFTALTQAFLAEGGTVDKFIGDSVMVIWNAPRPQPDHVERACRAALAAKAASEALNAEFVAEGLSPFIVRFGLHCGVAVVGNVGSSERMEYTALGNVVNLASRLEGLNKEYGTTILVSEAVAMRAGDRFRFRQVASVIAKGMTTETRVYELLGSAG